MARVLTANYHSLARAFSFSHGWKVTLGVLCIAQILSAVGFSMIFPFLPLYIEALGSAGGHSTELLAGLVISVQGMTMMIAAPIWGAVADRFGRKKMIMRALFGGAITLALMGFVQSAEQSDFRSRPARRCDRHGLRQQCLGGGGNAQTPGRLCHGRAASRPVGRRGGRTAAWRRSGRSFRLQHALHCHRHSAVGRRHYDVMLGINEDFSATQQSVRNSMPWQRYSAVGNQSCRLPAWAWSCFCAFCPAWRA